MDLRTQKILNELNKRYPRPKPSLDFKTPFELLIATILSAQCTDVRVNLVTKELFKVANTPEKILKIGEKKLMDYIKPTGFYRAKTHSIMGCAKFILENFGGKVPGTLEELQKLPGVGRKTASVVLIHAFGISAFPVDRHVLRVANRLGLAKSNDATETDLQLRKNIPEKFWIRTHLQLVYHGRSLCRPKPKCEECPLLPHCPEGKKRTTGRAQSRLSEIPPWRQRG